jgi:benzoyl-CoA 2,3-dioxygenase component B
VCERWNQSLAETGIDFRVYLPSRRFRRTVGAYSEHSFDPHGNLVSPETFEAKRHEWLPTRADTEHVIGLMKPVYEQGRYASWIAAPQKGVKGQPIDYEYVRLESAAAE